MKRATTLTLALLMAGSAFAAEPIPFLDQFNYTPKEGPKPVQIPVPSIKQERVVWLETLYQLQVKRDGSWWPAGPVLAAPVDLKQYRKENPKLHGSLRLIKICVVREVVHELK